ncbi:hypothetical protein DPMN_078243 [Dreissena polymorpha]|uniref:Uncharacterized protein n=1 Tax=Dreissena polymorpha TaxID=45954 RepID=A0A9D3YMC0_DREPO|nr:hypothetical protein DPMN_078243 [Dreissena polymorpha]
MFPSDVLKQFAHLRGFHDDWAKNVTSRVHVIQLTGTIFKLNSHIKETNVLTKFHGNWAKNVTSRVEKCPAHWRPCLSPIWTIFELVRDINETNVLTNFHDDWAKIVTSRVFTSHVIQLTGTIFELNSHIMETNVLTKFHENWAQNVTFRVFTCFHYIHIEKNAPLPPPPTGGHVFSPILTIFELVRDINKTNVLSNFHDDWAKIVTSRVFTRFLYSQIGKTALPHGSHVIQLTGTIFELNSHIKETNVLTKFHGNWAKNVTSRVFTCFHYIHIEKNALPTGGHVFSLIDLDHFQTLFTCFHYKYIEKNAPPTGGHVFSPIWTIFELVRDINKTNVLTNFHDDWEKLKTAPPHWRPYFSTDRNHF